MNEVAKQDFNFQITSLDQAMQYAKMIAESDLAPKDYKGKPGNCLIAMQFGAEVGLKPMQAIQNIAVINGRPCIWGDAQLALVLASPVCEYVRERFENGKALCSVKRHGDDQEYTYEFSKEDAKLAGLLTKPGCWSQYPERMMQMRARGFALRDKFADVLKGIAMREEVQDYVIDVTPEENKTQAAKQIDELIEAKARPNPKRQAVFEDVYTLMCDAGSIEELNAAIEYAKELSEEDKMKARAIYKTKYLSFTSAPIGESLSNDKG